MIGPFSQRVATPCERLPFSQKTRFFQGGGGGGGGGGGDAGGCADDGNCSHVDRDGGEYWIGVDGEAVCGLPSPSGGPGGGEGITSA